MALMGCGDDTSPSTASAPGSDSTRATPRPTSEAEALEGDLPSGTATYELRLPDLDARPFAMTVTLPDGWSAADGWVLRKNGGVERRDGIAITFWAAPAFVYRDPCRWAETAVDVEPTVDFMTDALVAQAMRDASSPRELAVGAHRVVEIQLSVPDDIDVSACDEYEGTPYFQSWASADGSTARYHQGPGQRDLVRLVDVDGMLLIVDVATWPELTAAAHDEIASILDSMTFTTPDG